MKAKPWIVLLGMLFANLPCFAQVKAQEKAGSADYAKEALVVEHYHTRVAAESDGTGFREDSSEVRILADAGVKTFAVLNFTYTSANEEGFAAPPQKPIVRRT